MGENKELSLSLDVYYTYLIIHILIYRDGADYGYSAFIIGAAESLLILYTA